MRSARASADSATRPARPRGSTTARSSSSPTCSSVSELRVSSRDRDSSGRDDREARVLGGRGDQRHPPVLHAGQQGVLLGPGEPVDLVDEQDGRHPGHPGGVDGGAHVLDPGRDRAELDEAPARGPADQGGDRGLAGAGRAPQDHRGRAGPVDQPAQGRSRGHEVRLPDELREVPGPHPHSQGCRGIHRTLTEPRGVEQRRTCGGRSGGAGHAAMIGTVSVPTPDPVLADRIRSAVPRDDEGAQTYLRGRRPTGRGVCRARRGRRRSRGAPCTPPGTARGSSPWARIHRPWRDASSPWSRTVACPRGSPWSVGPSRTCRPGYVRSSTGSGTGGSRGPPHPCAPARPRWSRSVPHDPRIPELLAVASPDAMIRPGDPRIRGWWGDHVRDRWAPARGPTPEESAPAPTTSSSPSPPSRRCVPGSRTSDRSRPIPTGAAGGCPGTCAPA